VTVTLSLYREAQLSLLWTLGVVISLAGGILSWHIPLRRRDMFINLQKAKTCTRFSRESLLFKWINRVCRIDDFPWNLARTFIDRYGIKKCRRILLFQKLFSWCSLSQHVTRIFGSGTWQIYKKMTNRNERKYWHALRDWCFVINTAQLFCINDRMWYPINSPEFQSVFLALTASAALAKQSAKKNIILSKYTL